MPTISMATWQTGHVLLIVDCSLFIIGFVQHFKLKSSLEVMSLLSCHPPGDLYEALAY